MNKTVYDMVLEAAEKLKSMPREDFVCLLKKSNFPFEYELSSSAATCQHEFTLVKHAKIKKEYLFFSSKMADAFIKNEKNSLYKIFYDPNSSNCKLIENYNNLSNNVDMEIVYSSISGYYKKIEIKESTHTKPLIMGCIGDVTINSHSEWSEFDDSNHMALVVNF
ncbi:hypothetical protein J7S50_01185 [Providencia rettgeri]|uniref:hypothetical protein n=1 Tax=Providencia rettgeri TaxID=587 RepID=UPI001B38401C|nr:hypothetical protein [Providencia rettgeri]MBQ0207803.1 hypothetical protein [Providencia rettgeri]